MSVLDRDQLHLVRYALIDTQHPDVPQFAVMVAGELQSVLPGNVLSVRRNSDQTRSLVKLLLTPALEPYQSHPAVLQVWSYDERAAVIDLLAQPEWQIDEVPAP